MMNSFRLCCLLALASCARPPTKAPNQLQADLVIRDATLVAPGSDLPQTSGHIAIRGQKIVYVGPELPPLAGDPTFMEARGKFVTPGLINTHVHVTGDGGVLQHDLASNATAIAEFKAQQPRSFLYYGFTTLIDLGTRSPQRLRAFEAHEVGPDLFYAGPGVVIGNGYGLTNWDDAEPNFVFHAHETHPIDPRYNPENHTPEAVIERVAASGAIVVKSYFEPGFNPNAPRLPTPDQALMAALKQQAHKHGLVLAVHGNSFEAHRFLAEAEVDVIAHGMWNWHPHHLDHNQVPPPEIEATLAALAERNIGYTPTLRVMSGLRALAEPEFLNNPALAAVLPPGILNYYRTHADEMYREVFGEAPRQAIIKNFTKATQRGQVALATLHGRNGKIVFGTDTPSSPTFGNPPGLNGYLEMQAMAESGMSPLEILTAATINAAKQYKLDDRYGTIETGKRAHLLVLNQDPRRTVAAFDTIETVILGGQAIPRHRLAVQTTSNEPRPPQAAER